LLRKIREILAKHLKNNSNRYFFLLTAFVIGIAAGAFTVNGLSAFQREELNNYFHGFLKLLDNQPVNSEELLKISLMENSKLVLVLWLLGVSIIGIPFIFVVMGIRGFITGFSSGFIIKILGLKGVLFTLLALIPKEIIVMPCIIALGVNGMNFSLNIIKNKSIKHLSKESLKRSFAAYCFTTLLFCAIIFIGTLVEVYIVPVIIRIIAPVIIN